MDNARELIIVEEIQSYKRLLLIVNFRLHTRFVSKTATSGRLTNRKKHCSRSAHRVVLPNFACPRSAWCEIYRAKQSILYTHLNKMIEH